MPRKTRRVLDTSILVSFWRRRLHTYGGPITKEIVQGWARELQDERDTDAIATPVTIEFLAGARSGKELNHFRNLLNCFQEIDRRNISNKDWQTTQHLAERVPRDGKPRHLGDCLVAALAKRLKYDVISTDQGFPRV